jgi:hypothetical protein
MTPAASCGMSRWAACARMTVWGFSSHQKRRDQERERNSDSHAGDDVFKLHHVIPACSDSAPPFIGAIGSSKQRIVTHSFLVCDVQNRLRAADRLGIVGGAAYACRIPGNAVRNAGERL